ncbi:hypothetical protein [Devosia sp. 1566]|uniref:hypothetical protein n=1 Tax=Devosia sp. 1566 TaxID=2499144 RepID=UPI000FDA26F4|nr:hypothetical protein [Devosia sp. 1566]
MATDNPDAGEDRRETIAEVIASELDRQAHDGAIRVDVPALAEAIDVAIAAELDPTHAAGAEPVPLDEGKRPEELNSTNDG